MKLQQQNKSQYTITIPIQLVRAKEWSKQDELQWVVDEKGNLLLKKINNS